MNVFNSSDRLTAEERAAVQAFLQRLHHSYHQIVQRTVLFGSKARGDSEPDSDIEAITSLCAPTCPPH